MNKRFPKFEDCSSMERFTGGDFLEARDLVAYASNQSQGIILKDIVTGEMKTITVEGKAEGNPSFSPDGSKMLFLSAKGKGRQIFCYNLTSEMIEQITEVSGSAMEPIWSPDGTKILFSVVENNCELHSDAKKKDEAIVIEDFGYKWDGLGFIRPNSHVQLCIVAIETKMVSRITQGECDYLHHNWASDNIHVVCVSDKFREKKESLGYDLLFIDSESKEITKLTENLNLVSYPNPVRPVATPDGNYVIAGIMNPDQVSSDINETYPEVYLYKISLDGCQSHPIFTPDEHCYQCVQFPYNAGCGWGYDKLQISEDGKIVYFLSGWNGQGNIYKLDVDGDGHAIPLTTGKYIYNGVGKVQNHKMMVTRAQSTVPEAYYIMNTETGDVLDMVAQSAKELMETVALSEPDDFFFDTLDGNDRIHGWVMPPHNMQNNKKYPTILYIHGGPHPFYTYGLTMEFQSFAAAGFGVIYCNPRGSSGYGWEHQQYEKAVDGTAYYDCLQFVNEATRNYAWIDEDRIGVTGGSYGGYMTNYIATHASKFKAYITQRSISNDLIAYASSDMQGTSKNYKNFEDFMIDKLKSSTVAYAERIQKPFLILHGIEDYRTPVEGAHQLYVAIKDIHPELPVRMVLFPNTNHEQPEEPRLKKIYYQEMLDWFQKYL